MAVALYARVSTTRQAEKDLSIPDQLRQMREWSEKQGWIVGAEYIEPGASATDDRRPVFQQMIQEATLSPAPYEAIIIHILSRFFRDQLEFGLYERQLNKHGVKVISITQQTSDDPAGEMARKIFSLFDEYQSKENGKHTLRAMQENARQGYWNGSRPPFGFQTVEVEAIGNKGKKKKRLAVHPAEAATVRRIYDWYLNGHNGKQVGMKDIARLLTERGELMRGSSWRIQKIQQVLADETYIGIYYFNKTCCKTRKPKPQDEWIRFEVEPIIVAEVFGRAGERRCAHAPAKTPPRLVNNPTLLTGLLKCGCCGAGMTLVTGKGGRYKYYKCTNRQNKHNDHCDSRNLPMDRMDELVLRQFAETILQPARLAGMFAEWGKQLKQQKSRQQDKAEQTQRALNDLEKRQNNLLTAIENGMIAPSDTTIIDRMHKLKAERETLLLELASIKREQSMPLDQIKPKQIERFCAALREKLFSDRDFAKQYLQILVSEIRVNREGAEMKGSYAKLAESVAEMKKGTSTVPTFIRAWRPHGVL